jgi:hypothetical protein
MRPLHYVIFSLTMIYTITIMVIEWKTSQDFVRNFLGDIQQGQILFFGINTVFSTFLLWATALLFAISLLCIDQQRERREYWFFWSQIVMFFSLGFDERFMVHERVGRWFNMEDAYLLLAAGLVELLLLVRLGALRQRTPSALTFLFLGALMFGVMIIVDGFFPSQMVLRLSMEDLAKFWGCLFLYLFAWEVLRQHLERLKANRLKSAAMY